MFYFSLALFAARLLIAAWVLFPHTYTHMQSHMYMCACVGIRYTDESPNECTLGPSILCARTGIFIWCHFNFPAFSFYRRNENESNGKKGSIQRCSSSIRQQQQQEHEEEEEEEAEEQLLIVVCHFWLGCFVASVLPLGLRWRAMRLLFVGCCPFFLSVCVCVCVYASWTQSKESFNLRYKLPAAALSRSVDSSATLLPPVSPQGTTMTTQVAQQATTWWTLHTDNVLVACYSTILYASL